MTAKAKTAKRKRVSKSAAGKSKREIILALLHRENGACVDDLSKATGWQAHSVRGFLSGTVKKKLGLDLTIERLETGVLRYYLRGGK